MISSTKNDQVKMVVELRKKAKARDSSALPGLNGTAR